MDNEISLIFKIKFWYKLKKKKYCPYKIKYNGIRSTRIPLGATKIRSNRIQGKKSQNSTSLKHSLERAGWLHLD